MACRWVLALRHGGRLPPFLYTEEEKEEEEEEEEEEKW